MLKIGDVHISRDKQTYKNIRLLDKKNPAYHRLDFLIIVLEAAKITS
jgi:hypothetical protein